MASQGDKVCARIVKNLTQWDSRRKDQKLHTKQGIIQAVQALRCPEPPTRFDTDLNDLHNAWKYCFVAKCRVILWKRKSLDSTNEYMRQHLGVSLNQVTLRNMRSSVVKVAQTFGWFLIAFISTGASLNDMKFLDLLKDKDFSSYNSKYLGLLKNNDCLLIDPAFQGSFLFYVPFLVYGQLEHDLEYCDISYENVCEALETNLFSPTVYKEYLMIFNEEPFKQQKPIRITEPDLSIPRGYGAPLQLPLSEYKAFPLSIELLFKALQAGKVQSGDEPIINEFAELHIYHWSDVHQDVVAQTFSDLNAWGLWARDEYHKIEYAAHHISGKVYNEPKWCQIVIPIALPPDDCDVFLMSNDADQCVTSIEWTGLLGYIIEGDRFFCTKYPIKYISLVIPIASP